MKIEIHKVHLDKKNNVSFSYKQTDKEATAPVEKGPYTAEVHEDLILAMAKLDIHLAAMTGQYKLVADAIDDVPAQDYESFHAKSYSFTGDKIKGIIISGHRVLENGKVFNFNTPNYLLEQNETTGYLYMEDVLDAVERINKEAKAFLDGSKRGKDPQGKIPFADEKGKGEKTAVQILKPEGEGQEWTPEQYKAATKGKGIPPADPEAMKRVSEDDIKLGQAVLDTVNSAKIKNLPSNKKGTKKVAQTAAVPSGEIKEEEFIPEETIDPAKNRFFKDKLPYSK
jgi:hypothetical protein